MKKREKIYPYRRNIYIYGELLEKFERYQKLVPDVSQSSIGRDAIKWGLSTPLTGENRYLIQQFIEPVIIARNRRKERSKEITIALTEETRLSLFDAAVLFYPKLMEANACACFVRRCLYYYLNQKLHEIRNDSLISVLNSEDHQKNMEIKKELVEKSATRNDVHPIIEEIKEASALKESIEELKKEVAALKESQLKDSESDTSFLPDLRIVKMNMTLMKSIIDNCCIQLRRMGI